RVAPGLVEEDAVLPDRGQAEVRGVAAHRVDARARGQEGRRGVHAERAAAQILAERALERRELEAEIVARQRAARLLRPAQVVDAVERDVVEDRRGGGGGGGRPPERGRQGEA